jgi:hypothetical protein
MYFDSNSLILKKFRPSRWLPLIMVVWGTVMTLMGIVKKYDSRFGTIALEY